MDKVDIHEKLEHCVCEEVSKRVDAYHSLTETFSSLTQNSEWGNKITKDLAQSIINNIKIDLISSEYNVCYEAAGFLGCYLANEKLMDLLTMEEEQQIIDSLIKLLKETKESTVLTRGLWSLAQSKFECDIYRKNLSSLLNLINNIFKFDPTNIMIYEALQVLKSLMESIPENMICSVEDWLPKIFEFLFHDALKVRGIAYSCLNFCQIYTQERKCLNILNKNITSYIPELKTKYCKQMIKLLDGNCSFILKIWRLLVIILGQNLHSGTTLINGFLEVIEKAFKCSKPELRIDAFKCWHVLIGNFSTDIEILAHPKRLKLLIAPFKSNNAKTEEIALIKLHTWWFLVCKLGDQVSNYFELVVVPLLKFCFDFSRIQSGSSERKYLMSGSSSCCTKYPSLLLKAVEVLASTMNHEQSLLSNFNFSLGHPVLNNILLMKNSQLIFGCIADALMSLDPTNAFHLKIGHGILQSSLKYVNSNLKENFNKKESIDLVKDFFNIFDYIENECKPGDYGALFCFEFLKLSLIGSQALSSNVLQSRFYHIPVKSKIRDIMSGCLANYFIHKLCRPVLLYYASTDPWFLETWYTALQKGKSSSKLEFFESVIEELENARTYLSLQAPEVMVSLWISTAKALDSYIKESQQINQGDYSDHDWTCIYNTLIFPLQCSQNLHCINDLSYKNLIASWTTLWSSFSSLTALTATAEPNCEAEFITKKMYSIVLEFDSSCESYSFQLALFSDILHLITEKFRFRELWKKTKNLLQSPLMKKKYIPLSNLSSLIELLTKLMRLTLDVVSAWRNQAMQNLCASLIKIFRSVSQEQLAWALVSAVNEVLLLAMQINPGAKFKIETEKMFIEMWNSLCSLIECRIVPNLTKEKLTLLSPLICVALQSSHTSLRQRTRLMWSTSFASTNLALPKHLRATLETVSLSETAVEETDINSLSIFAKKNKDGFSFGFNDKNKEGLIMSPRIDLKLKLSPLMVAKESASKKNRKQERVPEIDALNSEDFVTVASPKVKKRVFTKHQIEKMKEKASDIPALYNDMSQSLSQMDFEVFSQDSVNSQNGSSISDQRTRFFSNGFEGKIKACQVTTRTDTSVSESKHYSDQELNDVLRDASHELEKSLSDSVIILDSSREEEEYKKINSSHKRKSQTPSRKTLCDIRKKLKGVNRNLNSDEEKQDLAVDLFNKDLSPLATPLKSPQENHIRRARRAKSNEAILPEVANKDVGKINSAPKLQNENRIKTSSFSESEDEIPNSQSEAANSPSSRPKRNKRKSIFEDNTLYITPSKRTKLTHTPKTFEQSSNEQSSNLIMLATDNNIPSEQTVAQSSCIESNQSKDSNEETNSLMNGFSESENDKPCSVSFTSPSSSPCKITRSGRRIVAPNKDMPEPMTPPGLKFKKLSTKDKESEVTEKLISSSELLETNSVSPKQSPVKNTEMKITKTDLFDNQDHSSDKKSEEINSNDEYSNKEKLPCSDASSITSEKLRHSKRNDIKNGKVGDDSHKESITKQSTLNESSMSTNFESDQQNKGKEKSQIQLASPTKSQTPTKHKVQLSPTKSQTPTKHKVQLSVEEMETCEKDSNLGGIRSRTRNSECTDKSPSNIKSNICTPTVQPDVKVPERHCKEHKEEKKSDLSSAASSDPKPLSNLTEKSEVLINADSVTLSSKLQKTTKQNSDLCSEIHVANGGIVFTKTLHKDLVQTCKSKQAAGYSLRKCKSLEKFSPTKTASLHIGSLKILRDNDKEFNRKESSITTKRSCEEAHILSTVGHKDNVSANASAEASRGDVKSHSENKASPKDISITSLSNPLDNMVNGKAKKGTKFKLEKELKQTPLSPLTSKLHLRVIPKELKGPDNMPILVTPENKRIIIISSPRSSTAPVKKVVYSSRTGKQFLNNEIYIRSKTKNNNNNSINNNNNKSSNNNNNIIKDADNSIKDLKQTDVQKAIEKPQPVEKQKELAHEFNKPAGNILSENNTKPPSDDDQNLSQYEGVENVKKLERTVKWKSKFTEQECEKVKILNNDDQSSSSDHVEESCVNKQKEKGSTEKDDDIITSEKDSPIKSSSKLSNSIGTPERKKGSVRKSQRTGTRAAMLLACAKKNMKNRDENLDVSMEEISNETVPDDRMMMDEENESSRMSPNITPSSKGSISATLLDEKSWMKHYSSPKASPCGSILKKRHTEEAFTFNSTGDMSESTENSPSISKGRRVSFADPPVSERIEIPSLQPLKNHKAQKRLDMSQALDVSICDPGMSQNSEDNSEFPPSTPNCSQPLYSPLLGCPESVDRILSKLTTTSLLESLKIVFRDRGIKTVGDLCALSEMELQSLPVRAPKTELTVNYLKEFEDLYKEKSNQIILPFGTSSMESQVSESEETNTLSSHAEEEIATKVSTSSLLSLKLTCCDKDDSVSPSNHKESCISHNSIEGHLEMSKIEKHQEINNQTRIEEDGEITKKFSALLSREVDAIPVFIESLPDEARHKLFESLTKVIPYKDMIDMFHRYLKGQNVL